ncbi:hypothetical protein LTR96_011778, partial [Exophiala xenobiotica]
FLSRVNSTAGSYHGDLWEENTNLTSIPDELELGVWWVDIIRSEKPYYRQYLSHMPSREPTEQFDDRNRQYSIKFKTALCLGPLHFAETHGQ